MSEVVLSGLLLASIPLSCIAILLASLSIAITVGLKNSTHRIEWKTWSPDQKERGVSNDEEEDDGEPMIAEVNPNKRVQKNPPFEPFPEVKIEEDKPFFDDEDPNNTSHEWQS